MNNKLQLLKEIIKSSDNIVFFTGAGVSTESNIPDFRSATGLYSNKYNNYRPEEIISHTFFMKNTKMFYDYYFAKMVYKDALPNKAHHAITKLEKLGKLKAVITQNIDNLHQTAGTKNVYELHGSVKRNYCMKCHKFYTLEELIKIKNHPICSCGGIIKPDVVLYEEPLDEEVIDNALEKIINAEVLIVAGTSLTVQPAASFVSYFRGRYLIIINKEVTPLDNYATLVINESVGDVLDEALKDMWGQYDNNMHH